MIYVELILTNPDGSVKARYHCGHRHRSMKAAKACAKKWTTGVPARGGANFGIVYEDAKAVAQARVMQDVSMRGRTSTWRTRTMVVEPDSPFWVKGIATTESV